MGASGVSPFTGHEGGEILVKRIGDDLFVLELQSEPFVSGLIPFFGQTGKLFRTGGLKT